MAKRVLAWLLCMAMLLSLTPVIAMEANAVGSTMPGASEYCDHTDHSGWQAWEKTDELPTAAGNYYLEKNVEISVAWDVTANIHLCLNGHSITQKGSDQRVGNVRGGAELSIYDCTGKATAKITGGSGTDGAAFNVDRLGKMNLYGGIITGNGNTASGGAIYLSAANEEVKTGGMFHMYGGTITGNTAHDGIVYVAGGASGYTNTVFNMYGGAITGNSVTGNGGAIIAKAYGIVNITNGVITGNTTVAGAAVSVTDNAKLTVSGDTVIAANTNAANTADVKVADKLYVNELTGGSNITVQTTADQTEAAKVIALNGKQTAVWYAGWVTYMMLDGTVKDIGYTNYNSTKIFRFGHYHGDQKYTAYAGGSSNSALKTAEGYYYLTSDILRSETSAAHVSLSENAVQHLCLNGHSVTHRNPEIRLYYLDAGDQLFIEDCTSYYNEKDEFVAGGIYYGGASDSTVADGSFAQVDAGGQLTLENIKVSGFHSTNSPALRVKGEEENRGVLNMTGVELTNNSNDGGAAAVLYANTGATVNMTGCVIKNNTAKAAAAINSGGDAQITVTDSVITGNTAASFGACNVSNGKTVFKLVGATQVIGNTGGNLHLQNGDTYVYDLDGLSAGAKVGITLLKKRITAGRMHFTSVVADGKNPLPYCVSDDDAYKVEKDAEGRLALVENTVTPPATHTHKLCADSACTSHGADVTFEPWDDATKLPNTSGNYYLTTDVTVTEQIVLTSENITLCLDGHTIKADGSFAKSRAYYLYDTSKLTITDCDQTPGKITNFKSAVLMCHKKCTDVAISIYNIEITGNSNAAGGAIVQQGTSNLYMYNVDVVDNTAAGHAGALFISGKSTATLEDCLFSGNVATKSDGNCNGGAVNLQGGSSLTLSGTTTFTDNRCNYLGGAIYCHKDAAELKLTGKVNITGNTNGDSADNLYLAGASKVTVENLNSTAAIGVGSKVADLPRAISKTLAANCSGSFTSDVDGYTVDYKDNALFMNEAVKHSHCVCAGSGCSHEEIKFQPWDDATKLPSTSGNYYLTTDVTVSNRAGLTDANVNLCLNGYTIKAADSYAKSRAFYLRGTSKLTITDCAATPGKITGFKATAIMCDAACTDAEINIYNIEISGNASTSAGSAILVQGVSEFNLYSGKINDNTAAGSGTIYVGGSATANLLGGEISGNTVGTNGGGVYLDGKKVNVNLTGTKITGNTAASYGGGIFVKNQVGALNISGDAQITGNTAKGAASNLHLADTVKFTAGKLSEAGNVGISTGAYFRAVSDETTEDVSAGYFSDNKAMAISYQDKALFLGASEGHSHCFCAGENNYCDHAQANFAPWESATTLPTSGNWYLTTDVELKSRAGLRDMTLNLCLNGHTIRVSDDNTKGRAFYLYGNSKLTITDCNKKPGVITNAKQSAVMFDSSCVDAEYNMYNITMSDNHSIVGGGAVLVQGTSTFNMYSGTMTGNTVCSNLILDDDGNPVLDADGNQTCVTSLGGGAVASSVKAALINLYGGKLVGNSSSKLEYLMADGSKATEGGSGGAVYAKGDLNVYDGVEISGNVAAGAGGGIVAGGNETTITIHGGKISGNSAVSGAGMVSMNRTNVIMNGGTISGNKTTKDGAGVYVSTNSKFTMNGGTISGNISTKNGAGLFCLASTATLNAGSIKNNKAGGNGGGISSSKSTVTVDGEKVDKCSVITIGKDFSVTGNYATKNAGGIMLSGKTGELTLDGGTISNNTAKSAAGGVLAQSGSIFVMKSGKISNNTAKVAGAVYISTNSSMKMQGGSIVGNKATSTCGAIYFLKSKGTISGGSIMNNTSEGGSGAGVYMKGSSLQMYGTYIGYNKALKAGGGGVYATHSTDKDDFGTVTKIYRCDLLLSNCTFEYNEAKNGGGICASTNTTVNMTGGSLHDNVAQTSGAAMYHGKSICNYTDVKVYNNTTIDSHGVVYLGAKSVTSSATASFTNCKFYNNQVGSNGGALYGGQNCLATLTKCVFTENTAGKDGGAVLCRGNITMTDCRVDNNTAGEQGGGISTGKCGIRGSKFQEGLVLVNTTVTNNTAGTQGGGLYLSTGCKATMTDVEITGNKAAAEGGGFWAVDDTTLRNVTVTGNTSGGQGYAAWYDYSIFDGHSYFVGVHQISGDIIIKDNEGGDVYFGQEVAMSVSYEGLGEKTHMNITLDSGVLTNRLYGEYDYEGGNQVYTVTYGSRSFTDPETDETMVPETQPTDQKQESKTGDVLLYVGIAVIGLAAIAAIVLVALKKKKAGKPADEASKN